MPRPNQQRLSPGAEPDDRRPKVRARRPQLPGRARLAGQGIPLGLAEGGASLQQLGHGVGGRGGELVGRPGTHGWAPKGGDLAGGGAVAGGPQATGELVAGGDKLVQRQLVQGGQGGVQVADLSRHARGGPLEVGPTPGPCLDG